MNDSISGLPDDILRRIARVLPLKEAMRTSVLSSRWRSLWAPARMNFDVRAGSMATKPTTTLTVREAVVDSAKAVADKFLGSYEVPEAWKLGFLSHYSDERPPENEMTIMAIKGVDKELHLQFFQREAANCFKLKLDPPPASGNLASLRALHVRSVSSLGSIFVSSLFSRCQLLETLKLEQCHGLESITIDNNSSLQCLTISDCPNLETVSISAMKLMSFTYRGILPRIELRNGANLAEVELDLTGSPRLGEFECEEVLSLLGSMKEVEKLTISGWLIEWLCFGGVIYGRLDFQFSRLEELRWIDVCVDSTKRDSLACLLNICPILTKLFVNIDRTRLPVGRPFFHQHWHEPHLWMDYAAVKANVQQLKHLTMVRLSGFVDVEEEEIQLSLMDLLLEKAPSLEFMSITSR